MQELFDRLANEQKSGNTPKGEAKFAKKFFKTLLHLAENPAHNALQSHEIEALSRRYGQKVIQSYLENNTPSAGRLFWVYGPGRGEITVLGVEPHPEKTKHGYASVRLSAVPPETGGEEKPGSSPSGER